MNSDICFFLVLDELGPYNKASIPAKIIRTDPNGTVYIQEGSVGFELKCIVKGNPTPNVTWTRGIRNDRL